MLKPHGTCPAHTPPETSNLQWLSLLSLEILDTVLSECNASLSRIPGLGSPPGVPFSLFLFPLAVDLGQATSSSTLPPKWSRFFESVVCGQCSLHGCAIIFAQLSMMLFVCLPNLQSHQVHPFRNSLPFFDFCISSIIYCGGGGGGGGGGGAFPSLLLYRTRGFHLQTLYNTPNCWKSGLLGSLLSIPRNISGGRFPPCCHGFC